jgi:L-lactate utilization protein LutC
MPPIESSEVAAEFERELAKVGGNGYRAQTAEGLLAHLEQILKPVAGVVLSRNPLLVRLGLEGSLTGMGKKVSVWSSRPGSDSPEEKARQFRESVLSAEAGITGVDCVLAESGTLLLSGLTEGSQLASLAPPIHIALYSRNQVVATLEEALERVPLPRSPEEPAPGRSVVFITGPSRTADIEQILIRGVHGPKYVHAILVEDACLT